MTGGDSKIRQTTMPDHVSNVLGALGIEQPRILRGTKGTNWCAHSANPDNLPWHLLLCTYKVDHNVNILLVRHGGKWYVRDDMVNAHVLCPSSFETFVKTLPEVVEVTNFPYPPVSEELFKLYWQQPDPWEWEEAVSDDLL